MIASIPFDAANSRILVVGLGVTGLSCARYLLSRGMQVAIADSRQNPPGLQQLEQEYPDLPIFLGEFDAQLFAASDLLVVSPGVPLGTPVIRAARDAGVKVVGDIELFVHATDTPIVAITGSNGKSTVTTLLGEMARAAGINVAVGGNLGIPALDLLDDSVELYILELSSFQLETTESLQAAVATVLNVSADHMDRYDSLQDYAHVKGKVMWGAGLGVYNADDPLVMAMQGSEDAWFFTLGEPAGPKTFGLRTLDDEDTLYHGDEVLLQASELKIPGRHNLANALAAVAMATALGFERDAMLQSLRDFRGLAHRTEYVTTLHQVNWYNDSKGTNVGACIAALQGLHTDDDSRTVLIAGGDCKGADFSALGPVLADCVRALVLIGRDAAMIAGVAPLQVPVAYAIDLDEAVGLAASNAVAGDRVLLSPACASFDMFSHYQQRGDLFMDAVRRLSA